MSHLMACNTLERKFRFFADTLFTVILYFKLRLEFRICNQLTTTEKTSEQKLVCC